MKKLGLLLSLFAISFSGMAQMKLITKMLSNEKDTTRKASFLPIPSFGYSQETGLEFGVGAIYSYYTDRIDTITRSSNFSLNATYSTKKTYNISLKGDAWSPGNKYHFIGDVRFKRMPFNFYGLGNNTQKTDEDKLVMNQIKALFDVEKTFLKNAYTGISLGFENYKFTDEVSGGIFSNNPAVLDRDGGSVIYAGVSQSYDTRNSNNYPSKGFFGRVTYQFAPHFFGGDNFTGSQIKLDIRNFWPISKKLIVGAQGIYYTIQGTNTPFYLLQQLGNDQIMRGYYGGRYRDENLLASQVELRYRFMNRFGIVAFAGVGKVFDNNNANLKSLKPNFGAGGRYFFDTAKGLSVRVDYGLGEKLANEKRQSGFYISLAEAF
ncbi:BamA/TamA family outer membrane protein [Pedobacter jejuensis]|uniref:Polymerase n=1 Tax=Pedobacter jejuensis TaxID=1268550 RepID=A0A3N0BYZ7_9SPHI|nr:BamA/TamA family outer membrane protein [Pedobacter jejuensis]RNL55073.1 polymerase [Pedobacter jejuensis]